MFYLYYVEINEFCDLVHGHYFYSYGVSKAQAYAATSVNRPVVFLIVYEESSQGVISYKAFDSIIQLNIKTVSSNSADYTVKVHTRLVRHVINFGNLFYFSLQFKGCSLA